METSRQAGPEGRRGWFAACVLFLAAPADAGAQSPSIRDLAELSLEQLARLEVTSVSK